MAPGDVVSYLSGGRATTVRGIVDNLRKASVDERVRSVLLRPTGFDDAVLGKGPGDSRRGDRLQEVGQAGLRLSRVRRRSRLLPGQRRRQGLPDAVEPARSSPASPLTKCFCAARSTTSASCPTCTTSATTRPRRTRSPRRALPPAHREMDASLNRDLYEQIVQGIAEGRKKSEDDVRRLLDEGPFLPEDALRAGLIDDVAYEDQVGEKLKATGAGRRQISTPTPTASRQPALARPESRTADRGDLRRRHDRQRTERLRPARRRRGRVRYDHRLHPPGPEGPLGPRHRPADRQPRRIGGGVGCDLARAR